VATYFDALGNLDLPTWLAAWRPDGTWTDAALPSPLIGIEAFKAFFATEGGAFRSQYYHLDSVEVVLNRAQMSWTCAGVGASGTHVTFSGVTVLETDSEGLIARSWVLWDPAGVRAALRGTSKERS
jgi:hypothetical protein